MTLVDPMDCSPPDSSVHGILQSRILEWVAILFSRGSSQPRDWTEVSTIAGRFFTDWATREAYIALAMVLSLILQFSSVQLLSCVWLFATHGPQHAKEQWNKTWARDGSWAVPRCSHPLPSPTSTRGGSDSKESACNVGDPGLISGLGRCSAEENGYPLQYSCLENAMDRGAWRTTVHGVAKSRTGLSN